MPLSFAPRLDKIETSAIRDLFKLLGRPGIISFAGGFPDASLFDIDGITNAANSALRADPAGALQYGATEGYDPLRECLAALMRKKGVADIERDGLIVTTGSQQGLDLIGKAMIGPGDRAIVEAPTFLAAIQGFRLYGAEVVVVPIDAEGVRTDKLEETIAEYHPKLVYVIPTFGNPSGATLSASRRRRVLELAVRYQTLIVEDDPYGDLYFGDAPPPPSLLAMTPQVPGSREWVAYCGSLSKVMCPGLRIGWVAGPPDLLAKLTMCKQFSDAHTSTFAQATAARYLEEGDVAANLAKVRAAYGQRAKAMEDALGREIGDGIEFAAPNGGMFLWAKLTGDGGQLRDASVLAKRAIEHDVAFVPGTPFFACDPDPSTLRLSFATAGVAVIEEGVHRLAAALRCTTSNATS